MKKSIDYATIVKEKDDVELRIFLHNALNLIENNKNAENANLALKAIKKEWSNRLVGFLNNDYKADRPELGIFTTLGYHVGNDGVAEKTRRILLDYIISNDLPPAGSPAYLAEWDAPFTLNRYNKLTSVLKNLSNRYKNFETHTKAVREWREDIVYIEEKWGSRF